MRLPYWTLLVAWVISMPLIAADRNESQPAIIVGPNVQVSKARSQMIHNEVLIAADPANADHLIGCSMLEPDAGAKSSLSGSAAGQSYSAAAYISFDGGKQWVPGTELSKGNFATDPSCAIGPDGTAYFVALVYDDEKFDSDNQESIVVPREIPAVRYSKDGGKTWSTSKVPPVYGVDRPYLVVDDTGGKDNGRIYLYAQTDIRALDGEEVGAGITLWHSVDGGATFERPVVRSPKERNHYLYPGNSVIMSDGTFAAAFGEMGGDREVGSEASSGKTPSGAVKVEFSINGGESLTKAVEIAGWYQVPKRAQYGMSFPSLAVDRNTTFRDRLYVVWADQRSGRNEVWLSYSSDRGKSWSQPRRINDDHSWVASDGKVLGPDCIHPEIAVNMNGVVGVSWYDRRDNPDGVGYWVRFSASLDGGETWLPSIRVSEAASSLANSKAMTGAITYAGFDRSISVNVVHNEDTRSGDTAGLTVDMRGRFHPLWVDNRTGIHQIWTASVEVPGRSMKNGSPDLAELDDISSKVALEVQNTFFDPLNRLVKVTISLRNISDETIAAPLNLRAIEVTAGFSGLGDIEALGTDNHKAGAGAVWNINSLIPQSGLPPRATSGSRQLIFKVSNARPFHEGIGEDPARFNRGLVTLSFRVLGHSMPVDKVSN